MSEKQYRTVMGIIQFDPKDGEASGKNVRNIVVRNTGFKEQAQKVYVTVWPSHAEVPLAVDDVVIVEGTYTQGKGKNEDGSPRTFHNISANRIAKLGQAQRGTRVDVENVPADDAADDDDIPF